MISTVSIAVDGSPMATMLAAPAGTGPCPTLVVAHHRNALDDFTKSIAERLADNGFIAAAPHFYHRRPEGEDTVESMKHLDDDEIIADIKATAAYVQALPRAKPGALGIIGHCMGGRIAFLGAATHPAFKAAVMLYGGRVLVPPANGKPAAIARAPGIACPMLGFFGRDDKNPSPADADATAAELRRLGKRHEFHIYDGAGHGFQNKFNESYRETASEDAWRRYLAFFHAEL